MTSFFSCLAQRSAVSASKAMRPTAAPGEKAGLGTYRDENIEIVGGKVADFLCRDFDVVRKPTVHTAAGPISRLIKNRTTPRPVIDAALCPCCGTCVRQCPVTPKAVDWVGGDETRPPAHNYDLCIRCFCCQEVCPEGAISVRETLLGKIFFR